MATKKQEHRRKACRFKPCHDVYLLRDVAVAQPWAAGHGHVTYAWGEIATNTSTAISNNDEGEGVSLDHASCKRRFDILMEVFKKGELDSLHASGSDEDFDEGQPLLTGIANLAPSRVFARKQFSAGDDVLLLRQVNGVEPWKESRVMVAWEQIASALRLLPHFGVNKDGKACYSRFTLLVRHRRDDNTQALRRSGSAEEYEEKEELLDAIIHRMDEHNAGVALAASQRQERNARL
ncbi:TPA: hypothetical protein N0F65_009469 [Lagenidium giganteum]|uniref:Uncharacterized protein n=1 Tax=Lagenidium giganteum TaxID=4803 RepID=A0AAV2ZGX5_9STRA|nr:TPA: hypothetical protein N0F65_009469 [Lagenidium giganteum]